MEIKKIDKVKLKKNESFIIREGWLRKGLKLVKQYPDLFSQPDAMQKLGVGSKMVKSIKYWLLTTGLVEEKITKNKHELYLTKSFGEIINLHDPYFEDPFTLYLLHYKIVNNIDSAIVWHLFFNCFNAKVFTKDEMQTVLENELEKLISPGTEYSQSLFKDDCASLLKMYINDDEEDNDPEQNLGSPFTALGLLTRDPLDKNLFLKTAPSFGKIDPLLILYIMINNFSQGNDYISINGLLNNSNNVGKVLNLSRPLLTEYLDQLTLRGYITSNKTAGLDMIYFNKNIEIEEVLNCYYNQDKIL